MAGVSDPLDRCNIVGSFPGTFTKELVSLGGTDLGDEFVSHIFRFCFRQNNLDVRLVLSFPLKMYFLVLIAPFLAY